MSVPGEMGLQGQHLCPPGGPLVDSSRHPYQQFVQSPHQSSLHAHTDGGPSYPAGRSRMRLQISIQISRCDPCNCDNRASPSLLRASSSRFAPFVTHSLSVITATGGSVLSIAHTIANNSARSSDCASRCVMLKEISGRCSEPQVTPV